MKYLLCFFFVSLHFTAISQETTGNIDGRLTDQSGNPVEGALIVAESSALQGERGSTSDKKGFFRLMALPPDVYILTITHVQFEDLSIGSVRVRIGGTTSLNKIALREQTTELEEVTVYGTRPLIDPYTTETGQSLDNELFESLPIDRNYRDMSTLVPHVNKSFHGDEINIAGGTGLENTYYLDGMHVTDPYKGSTGIDLPYNFIKEVQVKTGGYQAEYGRSMGGVLNVVTYSGSNEFQGSAFGFFQNHRLAGEVTRGLQDSVKGDFTQYDFGLTIGGPVFKDRLWYFLAYNQTREREDINLGNLGIFTDEKVSHLFAGKLTYKAGKNTDLNIAIAGDPSKRDRVGHNAPGLFQPTGYLNAEAALGIWDESNTSISLDAKHIVNNNLLLEARGSYFLYKSKVQPATEIGRTEPLYVNLTTSIWSGGYGNTWDRTIARGSGSLSSTYFLSRHSLKAGFELERIVLDENWQWTSDRVNNAGLIFEFDPADVLVMPLSFESTVTQTIPTAYLQGAFDILPGLLLHAGIRWERQYFRGEADSLKGDFGNQLQPRLGITYSPGEGNSKFSFSYGRFYQQMPISTPALYYIGLNQTLIFYAQNPLVDTTGAFLVNSYYPLPSKDIHSEFYDEFTLGYEIQIHNIHKIAARVMHRELNAGLQDILDPNTFAQTLVNPGSGEYTNYPKPFRWYTALELSVQTTPMERLNIFTSYIFSRNYGNYTGLYNSDRNQDHPNGGAAWDLPESVANGEGLLPNDRTHVFKLFGSYDIFRSLKLGASFLWQSGTPLSEFGAHPWDTFSQIFVDKRGRAGRTPAIWDLNFRLTYNINPFKEKSTNIQLVADVLHAFSKREAVAVDQVHYLTQDGNGNQQTVNPNYGRALLYQQPMTLRLGLEVSF